MNIACLVDLWCLLLKRVKWVSKSSRVCCRSLFLAGDFTACQQKRKRGNAAGLHRPSSIYKFSKNMHSVERCGQFVSVPIFSRLWVHTCMRGDSCRQGMVGMQEIVQSLCRSPFSGWTLERKQHFVTWLQVRARRSKQNTSWSTFRNFVMKLLKFLESESTEMDLSSFSGERTVMQTVLLAKS